MAKRSVTREIPSLTLRAAVAPETLNEEKRTVDVVWTTGARVQRGFWERFWEELELSPKAVRMERLKNGAPLLDSHSTYDLRSVIGVVESAKLESKRGVATIRFDAGVEGTEVFRKVRDGILRNVSVGYQIHKLEKIEESDDKIPVYRATDWEPYEISIVPVGADAGAGVRAADRGGTNPCEFIAEESQMTKPQTDPPAADTTPPANDGTRAAVRTEERDRVLAIQHDARTLDVDDAVADEHIGKGTSADEFRKIALKIFSERDPNKGLRGPGAEATRITAGANDREKFARGAGDWLLYRAGVSDLVIEHGKKRGEPVKIDPGEFRGMRMLDLAREALERAGVRTRGLSPDSVAKMALEQRTAVGLGAASTSDFPVILETVLNKTLLAAYASVPDTWRFWAAKGSVADFRPTKRLRMGSFGALDVVNESGEYKNKAISDATGETIQAKTKGNIIGITRQALVNDDLDAFSRLPMMLGRAAKLSVEIDAYTLLALNAGLGPLMADGQTLFHATHNNISTGAAITAAALDADRVKLASQTDPSGNEILDLRPAVLLLPIGLGGVARQINEGQYDFDASNKFMIPNRVRGLFGTIVDTPRLSGTRRYVFASPTIAPAVEVVFLDGREEPYLEMQDGWRIDAREWKVRLDYGVGAIDWRGAVTNAGV